MRIASLRLVLLPVAAVYALAGLRPALADEGEPLVFTVHPSGPEGETLDEKLARRERGFRFICVGCARAEGRVADAPFRPIETLNAAGLSEALAVSP